MIFRIIEIWKLKNAVDSPVLDDATYSDLFKHEVFENKE